MDIKIFPKAPWYISKDHSHKSKKVAWNRFGKVRSILELYEQLFATEYHSSKKMNNFDFSILI